MKVIEFGTLVPGPMTSLLLAEAGATVLKIERPPDGDPLRSYWPRIDENSVHFHALNRGKFSRVVDLKDPDSREPILSLIAEADVLIEQFRPGVMARLGLSYETVRAVNPAIIYCSLSGWGQTGPKARTAGHDLNFIAEGGHLDGVCGADGAPVLPPFLGADIAGGVYPAVLNILLAHIQRARTGSGTYLDIAIADGLAAFHYDSLVPALSMGIWPKRGAGLVTGGSPRYQLYETADGRHLAVAAMEDRFWNNFCAAIDLPHALRKIDGPAEQTKAAIAQRIRARTGAEWSQSLAGKDVCCSIVASLEEALSDPQVKARGLFSQSVPSGDGPIKALPLPIAAQFRANSAYTAAPSLGEPNPVPQQGSRT